MKYRFIAISVIAVITIILIMNNANAFSDNFNTMNFTGFKTIADDGVHYLEYDCNADKNFNVITSDSIVDGNCVKLLSGYPSHVELLDVMNLLDNTTALFSDGYHSPSPGVSEVRMYKVNFTNNIAFDSTFNMDADLYWDCFVVFAGSCAGRSFEIDFMNGNSIVAEYDIDLYQPSDTWTRNHIIYSMLDSVNLSYTSITGMQLRYFTFGTTVVNNLAIDNINFPEPDPCGSTYIEHAINCNWLGVTDFTLANASANNSQQTIFGRIHDFTFRQGMLWTTVLSTFILIIMFAVVGWLIIMLVIDMLSGMGKTTFMHSRFKR